jgi:hypothetical protein
MTSGWGHFAQDTWELYHLEVDRNQLHDLAARQPRTAGGTQTAVYC